MPSRQQLLSEIERLAAMNGTVPTLRDMNEQGEFSETPYWEEFESWTAAIQAADLTVSDTRGQSYTDDELLDDLRQVASGGSVTRETYEQHGAYASKTYENRFGSWNAALRAAALEVNRRSAVTVTCDECGTRFERPKCHLERDWTTHTFCSEDCHGSWREGRISGESHPQFDPEAHDAYGPNWETVRARAIRRDAEQCVRCGCGRSAHQDDTGRDLHVHHIKPRKEFDEIQQANQLDNLVTLCAACHVVVESSTEAVEA
jgi:hypothetical protein